MAYKFRINGILNMQYKRWIEILAVFLGMFSLMPIVLIPYIKISMFTMLLGITMISLLIAQLRQRHCQIYNPLVLKIFYFFLWGVISSIIGLLFFIKSGSISNEIIRNIPKLFVYIVLALQMAFRKRDNIPECFFYGIMLGCVANVLLACIEGWWLFYHHESIVQVLFSNFWENKETLDRNTFSITSAYGIRVAGFNYDPAFLGMIIPILLYFSIVNNKKFFFALSCLALACSQSTTAIVVFCLLALLYPKPIITNFKQIVVIIVIGIVVFISVGEFRENLWGYLVRINDVYLSSDINSNIRYIYHANILKVIFNNPVQFLFGTGFGTSSYGYFFPVPVDNVFMKLTFFPYDPESVFITYLFDIGVFGLMFYLYIVFYLYKMLKFNFIKIVVSSFVLAGLFYHYTLTASHMCALIFALATINKFDCKVTKAGKI